MKLYIIVYNAFLTVYMPKNNAKFTGEFRFPLILIFEDAKRIQFWCIINSISPFSGITPLGVASLTYRHIIILNFKLIVQNISSIIHNLTWHKFPFIVRNVMNVAELEQIWELI